MENLPISDFMNFRLKQMNNDISKRNDIYYKNEKIYKFEAFLKFGNYEKMMSNKNVKIITVEN